LLDQSAHAAAKITKPGPGQHIGVPRSGSAVSVAYQATSTTPPPFLGYAPVRNQYTWKRDGADTKSNTGSPWGNSQIAYYSESGATRGPHVAQMSAKQFVCFVFSCNWLPWGEDANPYVVQYLPTAEIVQAPTTLRVGEVGYFLGVGTVDELYAVQPLGVMTWDFDDGTTMAGAAAYKVYHAPGVYEIKFTVNDGTFSATDTWTLEVVDSPIIPGSCPTQTVTWWAVTQTAIVIEDRNGYTCVGTAQSVPQGLSTRVVNTRTGYVGDATFRCGSDGAWHFSQGFCGPAVPR
jgi:hypothetical protein